MVGFYVFLKSQTEMGYPVTIETVDDLFEQTGRKFGQL